MFNYWKWLLAVSVVTLMAPMPLLAAEEAEGLTGFIEAGAATVDIKDDKTRVNEYSTTIPDDNTGVYGKVNVEGQKGDKVLNLKPLDASDSTQATMSSLTGSTMTSWTTLTQGSLPVRRQLRH